MKYIEELKTKGFERRMIVSFLIGQTEKRKLSIKERAYIGEYIRNVEIMANQALSATK